MKLILLAFTVLLSTISIASADCHGIGCDEVRPRPSSPSPQRCSGFGCPNRQATTPRCHGVGCEASRIETASNAVTTTGTASTRENLSDEEATAKARAQAKAITICGSESIQQISEWIIGYRGIPRTFHSYIDATATFQCE